MKTMRDDLIEMISDHVIKVLYEMEYDPSTEAERQKYWDNAKDTLYSPDTTLEQLWSMYKLSIKGTEFKVLSCCPKDHIAITFAGCYVGIEPDGYTHS